MRKTARIYAIALIGGPAIESTGANEFFPARSNQTLSMPNGMQNAESAQAYE
jgi:hypothetical protein